MNIYRALNRYCNSHLHKHQSKQLLSSVLEQPSKKVSLCQARFLCEISVKLYINSQIDDQTLEKVTKIVFNSFFSSESLRIWEIVMFLLLKKSKNDEISLAIIKMSSNAQKLIAILNLLSPIDKSYNFMSSLRNFLDKIINSNLNLSQYAIDVNKTTSIYFFNLRCEGHLSQNAQSFSLDQKYGPIVEDIFKQYSKICNDRILEQFTGGFFEQIVLKKDYDFIGYFKKKLKRVLDQSTGKQLWIVKLLEKFSMVVLKIRQKGKKLIKYQDVADFNWLYEIGRRHLIVGYQYQKYKNLEIFLMQYTSLSTSLPLLLLHNFQKVILPLYEINLLIKTKSQKIWYSMIKNPHTCSKNILTYYLSESSIKLKKYPQKSLVDPLHFMMIRGQFWKDYDSCQIISSAMAITTDGWIRLVNEKDQCSENDKITYIKEMLILIYQFLLESCLNSFIEYHPIQFELLPNLFLSQSFPTLAINCQFFFDLPWAHNVIQSLPRIAISYQNGFQLALKIVNNWKGKVGEEAAQFTLIESLDCLKKNQKKLNKIALKQFTELLKGIRKLQPLIIEISQFI